MGSQFEELNQSIADWDEEDFELNPRELSSSAPFPKELANDEDDSWDPIFPCE